MSTPPSFKSTNDDRCIEMVKAGIGITTAPASLEREGVLSTKLADYDYHRAIGLLFSSEWLVIYVSNHPMIAACKRAVSACLSDRHAWRSGLPERCSLFKKGRDAFLRIGMLQICLRGLTSKAIRLGKSEGSLINKAPLAQRENGC